MHPSQHVVCHNVRYSVFHTKYHSKLNVLSKGELYCTVYDAAGGNNGWEWEIPDKFYLYETLHLHHCKIPPKYKDLTLYVYRERKS